MQGDADEFVFKRKRKRLRMLYIEETEAFAQGNDAPLQSRLIPDIAALPEPATSSPVLPDKHERQKASDGNIITVEKFLRSSVPTVPKTKQAFPDVVPPRKSRAYTHRRRVTRVRKVTDVSKGPRESSGLAKTLFRAAVLTDGEPLDILVDDAGISHTRRPLKFVPFNKFAKPVGPGETDSIELSGRGRPEHPVHQTRRYGNTSNLKQRQHTSQTRVPLCLVPFREAEAAYCAMFP